MGFSKSFPLIKLRSFSYMFFLYVFLYNTKENRLQRKEKCRSKQGIKLLTFALQFLYIQLHWKWHMFQLNSVFQQENVFSTNFSRASVPFMNTFWMTRKVIYWKFEKLEAEFCLLASLLFHRRRAASKSWCF